MELSMILYIVIILFVFATMMGLSMLVRQLGGETVSTTFMYAHGIVAGASLVILIVYSIQNPDNYPKTSIILFILAGILGGIMFLNHLRKKSNPMMLEVFYGLLALAGFITLIAFVFF